MATKKINNYYINAPAGSGKTFYIKEKINTILSKNPEVNILCITYTNRAADEMANRIVSDNVEISTIHSFIQSFLNPFLSLDSTIEFYANTYWEQILDSYQKNPDQYNDRYHIKIDEFTKEIYIDNLKSIYYSESDFDRWLEGGLSHNELLGFAYSLLTEYTVIKLKLKELYDYIFIDEVQDTTTSILNFFHDAIKESETYIYYLGDKMQEVFDKYDGGFENIFNEMNLDEIENFEINYRSTPEIVRVLEGIYRSEKKPKQDANKDSNNIKPKIILCDSIDDFFRENGQEYSAFLRLRTNNRMIFKNEVNDLEDLFTNYSNIYGYGSKYSPTEILMPKDEVSNDNIIKFIYLINYIVNKFEKFEYGKIIQTIKAANFIVSGKTMKIFNQTKLLLEVHEHKDKYKMLIEKIVEKYDKSNSQDTLSDFINFLNDEQIITERYYEFLTGHCIVEEQITYYKNVPYYEEVFKMKINKFVYLCYLNENPNTSTQHGVKGEGHNKVLFVAEDTKYNPVIKMRLFLKVFTELEDFDFDELQSLYYLYKSKRDILLEDLGVSKQDHIKASHRDNYIDSFETFFAGLENNKYLNIIKDKNFEYDRSLPIDKFKNLVRLTELGGTLLAYKLFYVGCSRAMDELVVLIENKTIEGFENDFREKFSKIGFEVI